MADNKGPDCSDADFDRWRTALEEASPSATAIAKVLDNAGSLLTPIILGRVLAVAYTEAVTRKGPGHAQAMLTMIEKTMMYCVYQLSGVGLVPLAHFQFKAIPGVDPEIAPHMKKH